MGTADVRRASSRRALFLDRDDPAARLARAARPPGAPDRAARAGARAAHRGRGHRPDACASRAARGSTPTAGATCPSGEVFTGPHEDSRRGPHPLHDPVEPARRRGRGHRARVPRGPGGRRARRARRGLPAARRSTPTRAPAAWARSASARTSASTAPIGAILFDEKIGGTVHLALGRSYPETGGTNESAVHWDMICDLRRGGRLTADGEPIVADGASSTAVRRRDRAARRPLGSRGHAPHEDRRHHRPRLARPRGARPHGRGRDGRRPAELLPRQRRGARRDRAPRARRRRPRRPPGRDPAGPARARSCASASCATASPSSSPATTSRSSAAQNGVEGDARAHVHHLGRAWPTTVDAGRDHLPRRRRASACA